MNKNIQIEDKIRQKIHQICFLSTEDFLILAALFLD